MSTANACVLRKPEATQSPGIYRRIRPERTVRYQTVQENIETYLSQARWEAPLGDAVPAYVDMLFANISRAVSLSTALPVPFAMNAGMTFLSPFLVKAEAFARRAIPVEWVSKDRTPKPRTAWAGTQVKQGLCSAGVAALRTPGQGERRV